MKLITKSTVAITIFLTLGCSRPWNEEPYEVYWINGNYTLGYIVGNGGYVDRVNDPKYIESNNKYLSVYSCPNSTCSYYYIDKSQDHKYANSDEYVYGPYSEKEFLVIMNKLDLPNITHE